MVRDQVCVALDHFEALLPHHFPDGDQGFPLKSQPGGESVPKRLEDDLLPGILCVFVQAKRSTALELVDDFN